MVMGTMRRKLGVDGDKSSLGEMYPETDPEMKFLSGKGTKGVVLAPIYALTWTLETLVTSFRRNGHLNRYG